MEEQVKALESPKERSFSERFRELRIRRGWSRSYVAAQIDASNTTINRWESGKSLPAVRFRKLIYELFGVDAEVLGLMQEEDEEDNTIQGQRRLSYTRHQGCA